MSVSTLTQLQCTKLPDRELGAIRIFVVVVGVWLDKNHLSLVWHWKCKQSNIKNSQNNTIHLREHPHFLIYSPTQKCCLLINIFGIKGTTNRPPQRRLCLDACAWDTPGIEVTQIDAMMFQLTDLNKWLPLLETAWTMCFLNLHGQPDSENTFPMQDCHPAMSLILCRLCCRWRLLRQGQISGHTETSRTLSCL